jgi:hypothetical protein
VPAGSGGRSDRARRLHVFLQVTDRLVHDSTIDAPGNPGPHKNLVRLRVVTL